MSQPSNGIAKDYIYLIVIGVLFIMLVGSNLQYQREIVLLRGEIQIRDDLLFYTTSVLNSRMDDLKVYMARLEKQRDYLLGLWGKENDTVFDPRGLKTFD
jgi:hypothetical protein